MPIGEPLSGRAETLDPTYDYDRYDRDLATFNRRLSEHLNAGVAMVERG